MTEQLARARIRLSIGYVGVAGTVLLLFGCAIWLTTALEVSRQLDRSLVEQVRLAELLIRSDEGPLPDQALVLRAPGRRLFVFTTEAELLSGGAPEPWITETALLASRLGEAFQTFELEEQDPEPDEDEWRMFGRRVRADDGSELVIVAVADMVEADDLYGSLLGWLLMAGLGALGLTGLAGWYLSGRSLAPAQRAFASLRRFTADAAHELRTPVAVIRTESELALESERSGAEYRKALEGIHVESTRMSGLVDRLLTLARADADADEIVRKMVYLDDVLSDVAGLLSSRASEHGVVLELDVEQECPVLGDELLLRELVLVLADNALRVSGDRELVHLRAAVHGGRPGLEIRDHGPGIAEADLPLVFERFYRGDESRARGGAGLGLSIAKWIADAHGATIQLKSSVGHGTVVSVVFPPVRAGELTE